jgi:hypothetical protein
VTEEQRRLIRELADGWRKGHRPLRQGGWGIPTPSWTWLLWPVAILIFIVLLLAWLAARK